MNKTMIVSDLDGTLFNSDMEGYKVSEELIREIQKFKEQGNIFTIATGRPMETSIGVAKEIGINAPYITYNGAKIIDVDGSEIYSEDFSLETFLPFLREIQKIGASAIFYHEGEVFCLESTERIAIYEQKEKTRAVEVTEDILAKGINVNKILVIGNVEEYKKAWTSLDKSIQNNFRYVISEDDYFEIVKNNVSKGSALKILKKHLGIGNEQVISVRNHMNDKELIEEAHVGYAVANATEGLKNVADYITHAEYEKGVIEIIKKHY